MTTEQHPEAEKLTAEDLRARVEEIAAEADIDTSDNSEPTDELIARVRTALQEELERISDHYSDLDAELDEMETWLSNQDAEGDPTEQSPPSTQAT
jgi:hypothetical protein